MAVSAGRGFDTNTQRSYYNAIEPTEQENESTLLTSTTISMKDGDIANDIHMSLPMHMHGSSFSYIEKEIPTNHVPKRDSQNVYGSSSSSPQLIASYIENQIINESKQGTRNFYGTSSYPQQPQPGKQHLYRTSPPQRHQSTSNKFTRSQNQPNSKMNPYNHIPLKDKYSGKSTRVNELAHNVSTKPRTNKQYSCELFRPPPQSHQSTTNRSIRGQKQPNSQTNPYNHMPSEDKYSGKSTSAKELACSLLTRPTKNKHHSCVFLTSTPRDHQSATNRSIQVQKQPNSQMNPVNHIPLKDKYSGKSTSAKELACSLLTRPTKNKHHSCVFPTSTPRGHQSATNRSIQVQKQPNSQMNPYNHIPFEDKYSVKSTSANELVSAKPRINKQQSCVLKSRDKVFSYRKTKSDQNIDFQPEKEDLVAGKFSPEHEAQIVAKMKGMSMEMSKKGNWNGAHEILLKVVRVQQVSLGRNSAELANSRYHLGVAMSWLGLINEALSQLNEALRGLLKINSTDANLDHASVLFHIGTILGKIGKYKEAIIHLERAQEVEKKLFGHVLDKTSRLLWNLECKGDSKKDLKESFVV